MLAKGGAGFLSQGQAKKLKLCLCARIPKKKVVDQKKLKIWGKNSRCLPLNVIFSPPACGRQQKQSPHKRGVVDYLSPTLT